MMRIGHGYDVHRLVKKDGINKSRNLIIGGEVISSSYCLLAHSDGDVLIHAIIDSLLGATSLGDIGTLFPDTDNQYANINSRLLLSKIYSLLKNNNYYINNLDSTIVAQTPRLNPYINKMRANVSSDLHTDISNINIKATTTEGLGYIGNKQGIAAHAVVILLS